MEQKQFLISGLSKTYQLSGGGLDSTALTILKAKEIDDIVVINYGQTPYYLERQAVSEIANLFDINSIHLYETQLRQINPNGLLFGLGDDPFVVARNLKLIQTVADYHIKQHPGIPCTILMGLCKESMMFSDADPNFINLVNEIMNISYGKINDKPRVSVVAPFINVPKLYFLRMARSKLKELNLDPSLLWDKSFTCWTPIGWEPVEGKECGTCYHCEKKQSLIKEVEKCEKL